MLVYVSFHHDIYGRLVNKGLSLLAATHFIKLLIMPLTRISWILINIIHSEKIPAHVALARNVGGVVGPADDRVGVDF